MQREQITLEVPEELIQPEKISDLDTIFRKLEAEVWKLPKTNEEKMVDWSAKMNSYEIMLLEQSVLVFQNLILTRIKDRVNKKPEKKMRTDGENQETEGTGTETDQG